VACASAGTRSPLLPKLPRPPVMNYAEVEGRITNGEVAAIGQFPYQVGLSLEFDEGRGWCGGTLISDRWVLTAAHCTDGAKSAVVYLGAFNISNANEPGQHRIYTTNLIVHEEWNPSLLQNDISLINLPFPVPLNELIQPATLPKMNGQYATYVGDMVVASGWGRDSDEAQSVSPVLRWILSPVISKSSCNLRYFGTITDNMICISGADGRSTCNGDSGGPLVYKEDGQNIVIGATSFGIALGCEKGWPAVFTRVTSYLDWIQKVSGVVNA